MKLRALTATALFAVVGCATLGEGPDQVGFRAALGADEDPRSAVEPLVVPPLDAPATPATTDELSCWCAGLASDDATERDRCETALEAAGANALPCLDDVRGGPDREAAARAAAIAARLRFGDVLALRSRLERNFGPDDASVAVLSKPVEEQLSDPPDARVLLAALQDAWQRDGLHTEEAIMGRAFGQFFDVLNGGNESARRRRREAQGTEDPQDPVAALTLVKIVRAGLRSADDRIRQDALRAVTVIGGKWRAALFADLIGIGAGVREDDSRQALHAVVEAARAGTADLESGRVFPFHGPPFGPSSFSEALRPHAGVLMAIAEDARQPYDVRAMALEAAALSADTSLSPRVIALWQGKPGLKDPAFRAMVTLGCPEGDEEILAALGDAFSEIPQEVSIDAAVARRLHRAIPLLENGLTEPALSFVAIGAIAGPEDVGMLIWILSHHESASDLRPIMGALVRLSPLSTPFDSRARSALRDRLSSADPDVRFLAACALSAIDTGSGVAAWARALEDRQRVTLGGPGFQPGHTLQYYATRSLEQLTGTEMEGTREQRAEEWRAWLKEHYPELEER